MANFDSYFSGRTLPAGGGGALIGGGTRASVLEQYSAISDFGGGLKKVGATLIELEADTELANAISEARKEINNLAFDLESENDQTTYREKYNRTLDSIRNREIKNGLAARRYNQWLTQMEPQLEKGVQAQYDKKVRDKWSAELFRMQEDTIRKGSMNSFQAFSAYVNRGIGEMLSEEEAAKILSDTELKTKYSLGQGVAMSNPQLFLNSLEDGHTNLKPLNTLPSGHIQSLRSIAEGQLNFEKRMFRDAKNMELEGLIGTLGQEEVKTPDEVWNDIQKLSTLAADEKVAWLNRYLSAQETIAGGVGNPFTTRQNEAAFAGMLYNCIYNPQSVPDNAIWAGVGKLWTTNDALMLMNKKNSKEDKWYKDSNPIVKNYRTALLDMFTDKKGNLPEESRQVWAEKWLQLNQVFDQSGPDAAKIEKGFQQITQGVKKDSVDKILDRIDEVQSSKSFKFMTFPYWWVKYANPNIWAAKGGMAISKKVFGPSGEAVENLSDEELIRIIQGE